jgi:nucleolar GTP-binding protein
MLIRNEAKMKKSLKNRAIMPRKAIKKSFSQLEDHLDQLGVDTEEIGLRGRAETQSRGRSTNRSRMGTEDPDAMELDDGKTPQERFRSRSRARSQPATNRRDDGVTDETTRTFVERQAKLGQRKMNRMARQGEADRHIPATMPKHLVSLTPPHTTYACLVLLLVGDHHANNPCLSSLASVQWARHLVVRRLLYW